MPAVQLKRQEQIQERIANSLVARTELSDLADSSTMKHMVVATAREIDDLYFQLFNLTLLFSIDQASGEDLDERARDIQPGTISRISAQRAVGNIVFSRLTNTGQTVTIPAGTIVKTPDGKQFQTTIQTQITPTNAEQISGHGVGRDSPLTSAIALEPGSAGNVPPNTVTKFGQKPTGVDQVTNTTSFTQGRDQESDSAFRQRIKQFVKSLARSTVDALEFVALGVTETATNKEVLFSHVFEDPITPALVVLYIDDGAGTAETFEEVGNVSAPGGPTAEIVTAGLAGPPANTAVGGEEFLSLDRKPIKLEAGLILTSSTRGQLTRGTASGGQYDVNPASSLLFFQPPLSPGEQIKADYFRFTGLIEQVQKVIDGDPADRLNFPGYRAAGVLVRVLAPTVVVITVEATLILNEGADTATVRANVETAIQDYINNLGISGDVVRNELIERMMGVEGIQDLTLFAPASNITVLDDEIPRISSANIDLS